MSHTPPIPEANQSPYPIQEPPHPHPEANLPAVVDTGEDGSLADRLRDVPLIAIGTAVGVAAALVGGVLLGLRGMRPTRRGRGKRRS